MAKHDFAGPLTRMTLRMRSENIKMLGKLVVVTAGMFAFGYTLIPIYKHICEMTGINILSLSERQVPGGGDCG
jgi:cytochrome c oxidase assembly protein subunit 11